MPLTVTTPPAAEVLTLAEARTHLRVSADQLGGDTSIDDDLITELIAAARELCEGWVSRSYITTGWRLTLDHFPGSWSPGIGAWPGGPANFPGAPGQWLERDWPGVLVPIRIPRAPLISVSAVHYVAPDGTSTLLDPSLYQVVTGTPPRILPAYGRSWPSARAQAEAVTIDFTAGFGPDATTVPRRSRVAMKLLIGQLYENREATSPVALEETPLAFRTLLSMDDWGYRG